MEFYILVHLVYAVLHFIHICKFQLKCSSYFHKLARDTVTQVLSVMEASVEAVNSSLIHKKPTQLC